MPEQTIIVNAKDEVIGFKNRRDITVDDIYRVSAVLLVNSSRRDNGEDKDKIDRQSAGDTGNKIDNQDVKESDEGVRILIAQRSFQKVHGSGKWSVSAAGTVEKGEEYFDNIVKETEEELGIKFKLAEFKEVGKMEVQAKRHFFVMIYVVFVKGDIALDNFKIDKQEVEQIKWVDLDWLQKDIKQSPEKYTSGMGEYVRRVREFVGRGSL